MDKKVKARWLEALRSGKYRKARNRLRNKNGGMCCLGVLCDIKPRRGVEWEKVSFLFWEATYHGTYNNRMLPSALAESLRISGRQISALAHLNDYTRGWSKVIEYIEKNL